MRRDTINYLAVGSFVIVIFITFMVVLYKVTGKTGASDIYYVMYMNVEGVKYGTPVLYEGYQIGQVELIKPVSKSGAMQFKVTISAIKDWQIADDSIASIVKSGLLSAVAIDIQGGKSGMPLSPGDFITGQEASDIFSTVNNVADDLRSLSRESLRPLLDNLNSQITLMMADIRNLTAETMVPIINREFGPLLKKLNESADRLLVILNENNQGNIEKTLVNLEAASGDIKQLVSRIEKTRNSLDELIEGVSSIVAVNENDIRSSVKDLQKSLQVVSQHIDTVAHHLEGSSRNMNEFTRQIRENPGLLLNSLPPPDSGNE